MNWLNEYFLQKTSPLTLYLWAYPPLSLGPEGPLAPACWRLPHGGPAAFVADRVLDTLAQNGLRRGERGLQVYVMCEIPSNVILARSFAARFDGFSIGSNDLTQLTLGVDRDSAELAALFDEQNAAVEWMIRSVIGAAHEAQAKVGLCGQAPSDHPEFADFLVDCGINSISVSPDSFVAVKRRVAAAERRQDHERQHGAAVAW